MALSNELISQFVKATQDKQEPNKESTAYGKIVTQGDTQYVQLDGSELLTPISATTVVKDGDRVIVTIKNHTAIVTGDLTNPSASNKDVTEIGSKISEFEIIIADKVSTKQLEAEVAKINKLVTDEFTATNAKIETLTGKVAEIDTVKANVVEVSGKVTANEAEIKTIKGDIADFKDVTAKSITAVEGQFNTLNSDYADFKVTTTDKLSANEANITKLQTDKLDAKTAEITYANIDFSNIGEAAIEKLFTDSGIIKDLIMSDGKVTGELVGVTIKGDLIEGNTLKADKLVILGTDGLYYKLNVNALGETTAKSDPKYQNGLDGSIIVAESITAEKIAVDDLVAFGATIGGYHINNHALYSGTKNSINNTTRGVYLGDDGQLNFGDSNNFLKFFVDGNGKYKLEIKADTIKLGTGKTVEETIAEAKPDISKSVEGTELVIADGVKVIDFRIDGKSIQEVIPDVSPSPEHPSEIKSVGTYNEETGKYEIEIIHTGKNKIDYTKGFAFAGGTAVTEKDKIIFTTSSDCYGISFGEMVLKANTTYTLYSDVDFTGTMTQWGYRVSVNGTWSGVNNNNLLVFTTDNTGKVKLSFYVGFPYTVAGNTLELTNIRLYEGSYSKETIPEYQPYFSNSTVFILDEPLRSLPNGVKDIAYVQNGVLYVERKIRRKILDGSEEWGNQTENHTKVLNIYTSMLEWGAVPYKSNVLCNIASYSTSAGYSNDTLVNVCSPNYAGSNFMIDLSQSDFTSLNEFITWLSNSNVQVDYELATPVTEEIGPIDIPMDKEHVDVYYVNDPLTPYIYCKYFTEYAMDVADLGDNFDNTTTEIYREITDQRIDILAETQALILSATTDYVVHGDLDTYKESIEAALKIMSDDITMKFTSTSDNINALETSTSSEFEIIKKYFQFNEDGITIGSGESAIKLTVDNDDGIVFEKNGETFGYWDGNDFYTGNIKVRVNERAQFGKYAYVPRSDDSLMFLRVE